MCALAVLASVGNAIARDDISKEELANTACKAAADLILNGLDVDAAGPVEVCNAHPRREVCLSTKRFIEQHGKTAPKLNCEGASAAPANADDQPVDRPGAAPAVVDEATAELACAQVATGILTGVVQGNIRDSIALCNRHPNRQQCLDIKTFIELRGKVAPGLTCG
jgi:hypothetical protein